MNPDYWQKQAEKPLFSDLEWNIPEQKSGHINLVGGHAQNFATSVRIAEFLTSRFPVKDLSVILPDALRTKLPPLPNLIFLPSTDSGSFAKSPEFNQLSADFHLFLGDFSKNSETAIAISDFLKTSTAPALLTRDAVDLTATTATDFIERDHLFLLASMSQLQKLFRAIYFPRPIMLSMPLLNAVETLHKFTLSYPLTITTFHESQIIVAKQGNIITIPISNTNYTPLSLWSGQLAAKITAFNLYNPENPLAATVAAINYK